LSSAVKGRLTACERLFYHRVEPVGQLHPETSPSASLDPVELIWAAGFFDAEGSTIARRDSSRPGYRRMQISLPQKGDDRPPSALLRFHAAMLGMGRITSRRRDGTYSWVCSSYDECQATVAALWNFLGTVKRKQAAAALCSVRQQYESGSYEARNARKLAPRAFREFDAHDAFPRALVERIWAAGFLDGEGSFGLVRRAKRKRGPDWYQIRASVSQHGAVAIPAEVLERLREALGGLGRIECHGAPDDFKWLTEGPANVRRVLDLTTPWLGAVKIEQARAALSRFEAQQRFRGNASTCFRGHQYDVFAWRGGRFRRSCSVCAHLRKEPTVLKVANGLGPSYE
jgi:hypothetical protein